MRFERGNLNERYGIWGGLTSEERTAIARREKRQHRRRRRRGAA
jgi:hypothetical protein